MIVSDLKPIFDIEGPYVVAGPCSAESSAQMLSTAAGLKAAGISVMRAGVWKPRTKPGGFEGYGDAALPWLRAVKDAFALKISVEVATASHLRKALEAGVDGVWIGARTSSNPFGVQELADEFGRLHECERERLTVLVKNPISPDLELWIGAIERIYASGIRRLGAIHRGFGNYGKGVYRNEPRWALPIELKRRLPDLTVLCDPSHIAGRADLVGRVAQESLRLGFDGLFIESHIDPESALSDASQQLRPDELSRLLSELKRPEGLNVGEGLDAMRLEIDALDDELLSLLARRMEVSRRIGEYKRARNLSVLQPARYVDLMVRRASEASQIGLDADFVRKILGVVHEESVRQQISD